MLQLWVLYINLAIFTYSCQRMGGGESSQSKYKIQSKIDQNIWIMRYGDKDQQRCVAVKKILTQKPPNYQDRLKKLKESSKQQKHYVGLIDYQIEKCSSFCTECFQVMLYFQYFPWGQTLQAHIRKTAQSAKSGLHFKPWQAWQILKDCVLAMNFLQNKKIEHYNLNPADIVVFRNNYDIDEVKVLCSELSQNISFESNYQEGFSYAPQTLKILHSLQHVNQQAFNSKSAVFTLGMTILHMLTLAPATELKYDKLHDKIQSSVQDRQMKKVLYQMLQQDYKKRISFKDLLELIKKLQSESNNKLEPQNQQLQKEPKNKLESQSNQDLYIQEPKYLQLGLRQSQQIKPDQKQSLYIKADQEQQRDTTQTLLPKERGEKEITNLDQGKKAGLKQTQQQSEQQNRVRGGVNIQQQFSCQQGSQRHKSDTNSAEGTPISSPDSKVEELISSKSQVTHILTDQRQYSDRQEIQNIQQNLQEYLTISQDEDSNYASQAFDVSYEMSLETLDSLLNQIKRVGSSQANTQSFEGLHKARQYQMESQRGTFVAKPDSDYKNLD